MPDATAKDELLPNTSTMGRAGVMEFLYHAYGRNDPTHPQHALYTGLAEQARMDIGELVLEQAATRWGNSDTTFSVPVVFERG